MEAKLSDRLSPEDKVKVFRRALAAYYSDPETTGWPSTETVGVDRLKGLNYVLLYDGDDGNGDSTTLLACYRVRHDGKLKRLARLPEGMTFPGKMRV